VGIEFIGDVYHLDHDGGFRNTASTELNAEGVHFGRWWDIEFGLPAANSRGWGFASVREHQAENNPRVVTLEADDYAVSEEQNLLDREMMTWLTRPVDSPDTAAAHLLHTICAAHRERRRLACRVTDPRILVTLSGFEAVASRFSVEIFCNWNWPPMAGYTARPFAAEPSALRDDDWVFEESECGVRVYESGSGREIDVLPEIVPVNEPEFNPLLARRLLRACLHLQNKSARQIAIYGAGSHTRSLLQWGLPDTLELAAIVQTSSLATIASMSIDAVLLSSTSFESDMAEECRRQEIRNVVALYGDWLPLLPEEGWLRHQENVPVRKAADGVVSNKMLEVSHHPVCAG
jgi:hypothetical protein